jgi:uncharacterized membrane protein
MHWLPLLKFVHVLAAITALGSNVTYVLWLRTSEPAHAAYAIRGVRRLDRTLANPAYGVLLVTGVLMVATGAFSFGEHWIEAAIALYVLTALLGFAVFAPAIRRQLAEAEADPSSVAYRAAARRTTGLGLLTMAVVLVIVYLMVVKPF